MELTKQLVLASQSPRRRDLLKRLGFSFIVQPSTVEEIFSDEMTPPQVATSLANQKAEEIASKYPDALVLGADTIVIHDNKILGKPDDVAEARTMLKTLSGSTHTVITGIAVIHADSNRSVTAFERTEVTFDNLTGEEIVAYVDTGSPMDKAGSYGIQDDLGALFVRQINGDFYNVVGLPVNLLYRTIKHNFADFLVAIT